MRLEPSWRQGVGMALIVLLIAAWAVIVASIAPLLDGLPRWLLIFYYLIAGIAWILPLRPLLCWMATGKWRE